MQAIATCPTIISARVRAIGERMAPPIGATPSSDSVSTKLTRRVCHAGNRPQARLARTVGRIGRERKRLLELLHLEAA